MNIKVFSPFAQSTGYSRASMDYLSALKQAGCELDIHVLGSEADTDTMESCYQHLVEDVHELLPEIDPRCVLPRKDYPGLEAAWHDVVLVHTVPRWAHEFVTGDLRPEPGVKRVCLTTWETDRLSKQDVENLTKHFDLIIAPTEWNASVFERSGIPAEKLAVVPHCYDPAIWVNASSKHPYDPAAPHVFYNIGAWAERKNPIGLLKTYFSAFTAADNVVLKILTPPKHAVQIDVEALVRSFGSATLPKVEFIGERLSRAELVDLHHTSNTYVSLTRGEGWNLGCFEAALSGNAVIATGWSAHDEFLRSYPAYRPIRHQMTPAVSPEAQLEAPVVIGGLTITPVGTNVPCGIDGTSMMWAEPDLRHARDEMRDVMYKHNSSEVWRWSWFWPDAERYSYREVGQKFKAILETLCLR